MLKKDPQADNMLLSFLARIEINLNYSEKQNYIQLAKDFLAGQITADDFSYSFMAIYEGIGKKVIQMKNNESLELANFLRLSRTEFGDLLADIYGLCDTFSLDPEVDIATTTEKDLKYCAQMLLLQLQVLKIQEQIYIL